MKEMKELSKVNIKQKKKLHEYEIENEKLRKTIMDINAQQGEVKKFNEMLTNQLNRR